MASAAMAAARPIALRGVTASPSTAIPSSAATMNPIWAIGTSTLAWPRAPARPAPPAGQKEVGAAKQPRGGPPAVAERRRRRRKLAVDRIGERGREGREQRRLRDRQRLRERAVPQPDRVEEVRGAE